MKPSNVPSAELDGVNPGVNDGTRNIMDLCLCLPYVFREPRAVIGDP